MSNYLVSLRKEAEGSTDGKPGPELGATTYISFEDTAEDYRLIGDDVVADGEEWAGLVKEAAGGGPVIVFIHGYNNSSSHVVETQLSLTHQLAAPTAFGDDPFCLVSFDWPTYHAGTTYHKDHQNAVSSAPRLLPDCLSLLIDAVRYGEVYQMPPKSKLPPGEIEALVEYVEGLEALLQRQAITRFGTVDDVTNVVDFFLRPESDFVTGQILFLGGV